MKKILKAIFLFPIMMMLQSCGGETLEKPLQIFKQTYEVTRSNSGRYIEYGETSFDVRIAEFYGSVAMRLKDPSQYEVVSPIVVDLHLEFTYKTLFSGTKSIDHAIRITIETNTSKASTSYTKAIPGITIIPLEASLSYTLLDVTGKVRER